MNREHGPTQPPASFEAALKELEEIVEKLEKGNLPLAEMIQLYRRGKELAQYCDAQLREARQKIEALQAEEVSTGNTQSDKAASGET